VPRVVRIVLGTWEATGLRDGEGEVLAVAWTRDAVAEQCVAGGLFVLVDLPHASLSTKRGHSF
jgi:hypothetical protein